MKEIKVFNIETVELLAFYLITNQNNFDNFIRDFGEISMDNGYGTYFLKPLNDIFKVFSVSKERGKVQSINIGTPDSKLMLEDLFQLYPSYREVFVYYDDNYVYTLSKSVKPQYYIQIFSKDKVIENGKIIDNIEINVIYIKI